MTPLIPITLLGWIIVTIVLFSRKLPEEAVIVAIMGSFLFLPSGPEIDLPVLPSITKATAISYGILLAEMIRGLKAKNPFRANGIDVVVLLYCTVIPFASAISNGLGVYYGIYSLLDKLVTFGVFFWAGRRYFGSPGSLRKLTKAISLGGLILIPLILFEVRMAPTLCYRIYGFIPHSFIQHIRYGGYRPMLFMQHGLMVALWVAASAVTTFWHWRESQEKKVWKLAIPLVALALMASVVLCKSANGVLYLMGGIASYFLYKRKKSSKALGLVFLLFPLYFVFRLSNVITMEDIEAQISKFFDAERVDSLMVRLRQEVLFGAKALERPLFGWGLMGRAWPVDERGNSMIQMIDSMWVIQLSIGGLTSLASYYLTLGFGPWRILARSGKPQAETKLPEEGRLDAIVLSIIVMFYLIDGLVNAMPAPIYIFIAGAVSSYYFEYGRRIKPAEATESSSPPMERIEAEA